jgi:hypothetical protein
MGLKDQLQKQIDKGLLKLGDLRSKVVYQSIGATTYDPTTNLTTISGSVYTFFAVAAHIDAKEAALAGVPLDKRTQRLIVSGTDLPIKTSLGDYVTIDGERWNVDREKDVPGGSVRILFVCEP